MKTAAAPLIAFLNNARQGLSFDLWTLQVQSGTVLRWTDADIDIKTLDGRVFTRGPVIKRDRVKWVRGIEVDQLGVDFQSSQQLIDGQRLPVFATLGGLDGAVIQLERVYLNDAGVVQGQLVWFLGAATDVDPTDMGAHVVVKSQLTQLGQQLPRNLYQAGCLNNLYDSNCAAAKIGGLATVAQVLAPTAFTCGTVGTGSIYALGVVKFTGGANVGISRTVLSQNAAILYFSRPFPFPVLAGDTFSIYAGCDKTFATCRDKFANTARFRGAPFVPVPETIT